MNDSLRALYAPLALAFALAASGSHAQSPLLVAYGHDYPPFAWKEQGAMKGLQVDIMREILEKRLKVPVVHQGYPWKRAQKLVEQGKADALFTTITPERLAYSVATQEVLIPVNNTLFTYAGHPRLAEMKTIKTLSDLHSYQLVDYIGGSWSATYLPDMEVYRVSELSLALHFLAKRRADLMVQSDQVVHYNIKTLGLQGQLVEIPISLGTAHHYLLISKTSAFNRLLPLVDQIAREMQADGSMQAIYDRYRPDKSGD